MRQEPGQRTGGREDDAGPGGTGEQALLTLRSRAHRFNCTVKLERINRHFGGVPGGSPFTTRVSVERRENGRVVAASAARPGELGNAIRNVLAVFP